MPYPGVPDELISKMDSCVEKVMAGDDTLDKSAAIAICMTSVMGKELSQSSVKANSFSAFKNASGAWRWVLLSSNSFEDLDREIISQEALEADVERADKDKDFGPLRWWHVPGLELGDCDFNAMEGRVLVESGTFRHEKVAEAVSKSTDQLGASIGFLHPISEPDGDGVYYNIRRYERSLLPREAAANPSTTLLVEKENAIMKAQKEQELRTLMKGVDGSVIDNIIAMANSVENKNLEAGVRHKETDAPVAEPPAPVVPAETPAPAEKPVEIPALPPEVPPAPEAATKEISKDEQVQKVRDAVYALSPGYGGSMPGGYWVYSETVFDERVIICEGEGGDMKMWSAPYMQDANTGAVTLAPRDQWSQVKKEWVPVGKEKAVAPPPPPVKAAVTAPAPAAPAAETPALSADSPVGELTLGQLGEIVGKIVDQAMAKHSEVAAPAMAATKELGTRLSTFETKAKGWDDTIAAIKITAEDLTKGMKELLGDAPSAVARAARAAMSDGTLLDGQSAETKERLRNAAPQPDTGLEKFVGAITNSLGGLVLGGGPPAA